MTQDQSSKVRSISERFWGLVDKNGSVPERYPELILHGRVLSEVGRCLRCWTHHCRGHYQETNLEVYLGNLIVRLSNYLSVSGPSFIRAVEMRSLRRRFVATWHVYGYRIFNVIGRVTASLVEPKKVLLRVPIHRVPRRAVDLVWRY